MPQDVAIMGFDNIEFVEHAAMPISSVKYEVDLVTELAVERLLQLIAAPTACLSRVSPSRPRLIVCDSTTGGGD
ncbi:hypothetical protein ASD83_05310 [Devosia sp. Root685]|nr:hypothetical protein ASD83_05310 [Devosia sp. Root685]